MKNLHDIIRNYTVKRDCEIKAICKPLVDLLNIPVFTYYRIDTKGNFVTLSNFAEQCDFYYTERMYLINPYLTHPHLMHSGYILTASTPDDDYLKTVQHSQQHYQLHPTFLMLQRSEDSIEGFLFGTREDIPDYSHHYLQHLELLKKFGRYFVQAADPFIKQMNAEGFNLLEAKGNAFLERNPTLPLSNKNPKIEDFLNLISLLSPREQECLDLFHQGNSAQATAAKLGLSRRTVEHYFENIKTKLGCHSKWDLLQRG